MPLQAWIFLFFFIGLDVNTICYIIFQKEACLFENL